MNLHKPLSSHGRGPQFEPGAAHFPEALPSQSLHLPVLLSSPSPAFPRTASPSRIALPVVVSSVDDQAEPAATMGGNEKSRPARVVADSPGSAEAASESTRRVRMTRRVVRLPPGRQSRRPAYRGTKRDARKLPLGSAQIYVPYASSASDGRPRSDSRDADMTLESLRPSFLLTGPARPEVVTGELVRETRETRRSPFSVSDPQPRPAAVRALSLLARSGMLLDFVSGC